MNKARIIVSIISLLFFSIAYLIASVVIVEASKTTPIQKVERTSPKIPQCNKELWLRIKEGC
jgi:hypothetical protein|tara:strand:+ start:336 stop:521 length:186 start_codon:yes stop_codon:yes gene_type:complete